MSEINELYEELKQKRDELRLKIHLASKEVREEWDELEEKMEEFSREAKFRETGEGVGRAVKELGSELKLGYKRIREAMKDKD